LFFEGVGPNNFSRLSVGRSDQGRREDKAGRYAHRILSHEDILQPVL
jgi:hypothetical protein